MPFSLLRYKARLAISVVAVLLCAMTGCGGPSHDIVGKWHTPGNANAIVWEFSGNGSVLIGNTRGRYSFGDNNRIKIEAAFPTSVFQVEFAGGRMTLREGNGFK